jgi:hypothetical protein
LFPFLQCCHANNLLISWKKESPYIYYAFNRPKSFFSGCSDGIGKGNYSNGAGSGAGHGGRGGSGNFNGRVSNGGNKYGNADLPCELGSGTEGPDQSYGHVGGGMIGNVSTSNTSLVTEKFSLGFDYVM